MTGITNIVTANNVDNLLNDSFKDENDKTKLKDSIVKIGNKSYSVKFAGGHVHASRIRNGFFGSIKSLFSSSHTATAAKIETRLTDLARNTQIYSNTMDCLNKTFGGRTREKTIEIANYGFSPNRMPAVQAINDFNSNPNNKTKISFNSIDCYNYNVGISWPDLGAESLPILAKDIREGNLQVSLPDEKDSEFFNNVQKERCRIGADKSVKWANFLHKNADKVDIIGKLYKLLNEENVKGKGKKTGWAAEFAKNKDKALQKFVAKNIPVRAKSVKGDVAKLATLLKEYVNTVGSAKDPAKAAHEFTEKHFRDRNGYTPADIARGCEMEDVSTLEDLFNGVLKMATFRQTSKLGLDFFRKNKVPVMFQWSDHNKITGPGDRDNKWWHNDPKKFGDNVKGNAITMSETRHLEKITSGKLGPADLGVLRIMGAHVKF